MARIGRSRPVQAYKHLADPLVAAAAPVSVGVPFRQDVYGASSYIAVEVAWGANLAAAPSSWTWYDVTADVMYNPGITATFGRGDETSQSQPSSAALSLLNLSGNYSDFVATGIYGAGVSKGMPLRVRRNLGTGFVVEFQGRIWDLTPTWDTTGKLPIVKVQAGGRMRQLGQPKTPGQSALYRAMPIIPNLLAYWPLEDGSSSTYGAPLVGTTRMAISAGAPVFGYAGGGGSASAVSMPAGAVLAAPVPTSGVPATSWRVACAYQHLGGLSETDPISWTTTNGDQWTVRMVPGVALGNTVTMNLEVDFGGSGFAQGFNTPYLGSDTSMHSVQIIAVQNGANIDVAYSYDNTHWLNAPSMLTGHTLAPINGVQPGTTTSGNAFPNAPFSICHVAVAAPSVINPSLTAPDVGAAATGWTGELPHARIARVAAEEGIPCTVAGVSSTPMGPQPIDSPLNIFRDAEKADIGGVLYDGFSDGIGYVCRNARYNQTPVLTLDAGLNSQLAPPFAPANDDQRLLNQFTASRTNGGSVTFADTTSSLSINAVGTYPQSDSYNYADDANLGGAAGWRVNLGTVRGLRYPTLAVNWIQALAAASAPTWLAQAATSLPIGFRVDIANVTTSALNHPPGTPALVVEGYAVKATNLEWNITANCSAWLPNNVFTLDSTVNGRVDASATTLGSTLTSSATGTFNMATALPWITTTASPADFPLEADIDGEHVTVSNIGTWAAGVQPFTIAARSVNGYTLGHAVGARIGIWQPGRIGL